MPNKINNKLKTPSLPKPTPKLKRRPKKHMPATAPTPIPRPKNGGHV